MKHTVVAFLVLSLFAGASAMADISVSYEHLYSNPGDGTLTCPYAWATVDNFDSGRPGWNYTGNGAIVSGTVSGSYAAPFNSSVMAAADATKYLTVPKDSTQAWAMVDFGGATYNYAGLFWGSIDTYNTIEFLKGGSVVANGSWTGNDLPSYATATGDQSARGANLYVNFHGVPDFDAVRFISTSMAFELDNLAVGNAVVPVPGAVLLGMLGLSVAGAKLRKRS